MHEHVMPGHTAQDHVHTLHPRPSVPCPGRPAARRPDRRPDRRRAAALAGALLAAPLGAQTAVSPADRATLEGSSFTHFPLGRENARFQFLHSDLPVGMVVSGHAYRRDATQVRGLVDGFVADLEVALSLSPNTPATASATFANNTGPSPTVVLPRTAVTFPATDRPALDPSPLFDLVVPYQFPFVLPANPATVCVDMVLHGNVTSGGPNRNISIYLDAHELHTNGSSEQPGFRTGTGCAAPGNSATSFATMSMWHLGTASQFDVSLRNGVPDDGTNLTRAWLALGLDLVNWPWPARPECVQQSSTNVWFVLGGTDAQGRYDGSLANLPLLPPGYRIWCQAGSIHLGTGDLAFADASGIVTPPPGPTPLPAVRISASTDRTAASGSVSSAVPVTLFY